MPESDYKYTSIDIANILRWEAYSKKKVALNKTQLEKLLYITYGIYAALTGKQLFEEAPKAWPFGPVFPRVAKHVNIDIIPENPKINYKEDDDLAQSINFVIDRYSNTSAKVLSIWSHEEDGPWYQTMYPDGGDGPVKWNTAIDFEVIKEYFKRKFLRGHGK